MRKLLVILLFMPLAVLAQPDSLELLFTWDDASIEASELGNNRYNEVFGFTIGLDEYAVIGSTKGAHIFSLKEGEEELVAFIEGSTSGREIIHRDFDVYQNYLYMVADQGDGSTLQIIDLSNLPESVEEVYSSNEYIIRAHNIFIDHEKRRMYSCGGALSGVVQGFAKPNHLSIFSLDDPENPKLLLDCREQIGFWRLIGYVHDIYVRNDTAYCNAGQKGMFVIDFSSLTDVKILGSLREYEHKGYNHQGFLHPTKNLYVMADETHGMDLKMVDVTDLKEMELLDRFTTGVSAEYTVPHNAYWLGDYVYVSYYLDGVYIFDASDPTDVKAVYHYDTNELFPEDDFNGCWGVYPYLPSGRILASGMVNGLFVFWSPFKQRPQEVVIRDLSLKRNLVKEELELSNNWIGEEVEFSITSVTGAYVFHSQLPEGENIISLPPSFDSGWYSLKIKSKSEVKYFRFYKI